VNRAPGNSELNCMEKPLVCANLILFAPCIGL
jgi:hypothetical protein